MPTIQEQFESMHLLPRSERQALSKAIRRERPEALRPYLPKWWWWRRCRRNVLVVTDNLSFGTGDFGLSEFLTTFNELEAQSWVDYRVTTAYHRDSGVQSANPVVVNHIDDFEFTAVDLGDFDQIWLFGISGVGLDGDEVAAVADYMDNGGGLFATGDHGTLGNSLCGALPRVQDMRYWSDFGNGEVSMTGARRNDTNQPTGGAASSTSFDDQSDATPQPIAVRTFGLGNPHPLLSISPSIRPSGIIDIMPDHPHEGECRPETTFEVNGVKIPTQIIATSFVTGGNTAGGKQATEPHCFPSIAVWDGRRASAGRIVVDSTWHHFVNINLTATANGPGLNAADWEVVRHYYMNIALWMSRRRIWWCWWYRLIHELVADSRIVEASIEVALQDPAEASLSELQSIGALAEDVLSTRFNPGFARSFMLDLLADVNPDLAEVLDDWTPSTSRRRQQLHHPWVDLPGLMRIAVGAGVAAVRVDERFANPQSADEESLEAIQGLFNEGASVGFNRGLADLESEVRRSLRAIRPKRPKTSD